MLLVAVDDTALVQVVGGKLNQHAVTDEHADAELPNFSGQVAQDHVSALKLDPEHPVAQRLYDFALNFNCFFFSQLTLLPGNMFNYVHGLVTRAN